MANGNKAKFHQLTPADIQALQAAVRSCNLPEREKDIVLAMIDQVIRSKASAGTKRNSLKKIWAIIQKKTEKLENLEGKSAENGSDKTSETQKGGQGRNGVEDYPGAKIISHPHPLKGGDNCPDCGRGKLYAIEAGKVIRIKAQAPFTCEIHRPEKLRCNSCQGITTASFPEKEEEKYDEGCKALLAIYKYGHAIPFYRMASINQAMGTPLPPSTQYELVEGLWTQVAVVYKALLLMAAQWGLFFVDDTGARILSLMKIKQALKAEGKRCGIYTTGIIARNKGQEIHLFFTGNRHAGENLKNLMDKRLDGLDPPLQMADGLSANRLPDGLTQLVLCLAHGRRNFFGSLENHPEMAEDIICKIAIIYENEGKTVTEKWDPEIRLDYHKKHSLPLMEEIRRIGKDAMENRRVEPNSDLGDAFKYFEKHYDGLTGFCRIPGCPLDNNAVERLLKKAVLHRKNSLFYKTENGAAVGDCLMSLISTCIAAKKNPFDYLVALQKNHQTVARKPELWLPWNYEGMLKSVISG